MKDVGYYLQEGRFTPQNDIVRGALEESVGMRQSVVGSISKYVANLKFAGDGTLYRDRDSSEIISSGYVHGCSDVGLVFCSMARAAGVPTKFVDSFNKKWMKNEGKAVGGHVFTDIFTDGKWARYEPIFGFLKDEYFLEGQGGYLDYGEGLDFSCLSARRGLAEKGALFNIDSVYKMIQVADVIKRG